MNFGENQVSGSICVCSCMRDSKLGDQEPGNGLQPAQLVGFSFPELGRGQGRNQIRDLHLRPGRSGEGHILLKSSVSHTVHWISVRWFTSNRWKPYERGKNNKIRYQDAVSSLCPITSHLLLC